MQFRKSLSLNQSGRPDSNRGPPAPKAGALPDCATPRKSFHFYDLYRLPKSSFHKLCQNLTHNTIAQRTHGQDRPDNHHAFHEDAKPGDLGVEVRTLLQHLPPVTPILLTVTILATLGPARRAITVQPIEVLKVD